MWTLHLVTHVSSQRARDITTRLNQQGFDAYVEAYGNLEVGRQRWQVRVGCFLNEAAARHVATPLVTLTERQPTLVPLTTGADVRVCVEHQLGFLVPDQWQLFAKTAWAVAFEISLAGQTGYVVYSDAGWQVMQDVPTDAVLQPWLLADTTNTSINNTSINNAPTSNAPANQAETNDIANPPVNLSIADAERRFGSVSETLAGASDRILKLSSEENVGAIVYRPVDEVARVEGGLESTHSPPDNQADGQVEDAHVDDSLSEGLQLAQPSVQHMTPEERALAASLARLPRQPQVSLQRTEPLTQQDGESQAGQEHQDVPDKNSLSQHIIIATGNLLWQSPSAAVVQTGGQVIAMVMFPPPQANLAQRDLVQSNLVQSNLVQSDLIQSNLVQSNLVQRDLIQSDLVQSKFAEIVTAPTADEGTP
jgi:hypothetical protein